MEGRTQKEFCRQMGSAERVSAAKKAQMNIVTVRASALKDLLDCPARFEAKHIRGLRMPRSGKAQLGTAVHASTALYDSSALAGQGITIEEAEGAAVDAIHKPEEDVEWDDDMGASDAEKIARALHTKYCRDVAPTQTYAAVEVKCERLEVTDLGLALTGTTDRIRKSEDGFGIVDLKTGKQAVSADGTVKTAGHAVQLGVYELLAENASGLRITEPAQIIGMQTGKTEKAQRIGTAPVHAARELLIGTQDQPGVLEHASQIIHRGIFFGNPSSNMCHEKYCPAFPTCPFRR